MVEAEAKIEVKKTRRRSDPLLLYLQRTWTGKHLPCIVQELGREILREDLFRVSTSLIGVGGAVSINRWRG